MTKFLKGNYRLNKKGRRSSLVVKRPKENLTDKFEKSALAKLGGSLCFVTKKESFIWTGDEEVEKPGKKDR